MGDYRITRRHFFFGAILAARAEGKLLYDAKTGLFTNNKNANKYLDMAYRKGWEVKL
jgi:hypothetical protein